MVTWPTVVPPPNRILLALLALVPLVAGCVDQASGAGGSRDRIRIVGSSTVFPFATLVAERFVDTHAGVRAPVIEATGTGAGIRLFCGGLGAAHPDIADASRRMRASEYARCRANGVGAILEVPIGLDGVAFAQATGGLRLRLTPADLYRALAARPGGQANTARTWADVDPALPAVPIQVYGPPATSGTRDALAELILARGCIAAVPGMAAVRERDPAAFARRCTAIRDDGAYVDAGENDNFIVQKLGGNARAIGIFGYSYLAANADRVAGVAIDGIAPSYAAIADGSYPGSRPLYLYVKAAHLDAVPGLRAYLADFAASWQPDGPLVSHGLIAAPAAVRARAAATLVGRMALDPRELR